MLELGDSIMFQIQFHENALIPILSWTQNYILDVTFMSVCESLSTIPLLHFLRHGLLHKISFKFIFVQHVDPEVTSVISHRVTDLECVRSCSKRLKITRGV